MTCRCAGTASGSWSSVMSPPGGAWITTSTACHWKTSSSRTSPGKKDGNTRSASHPTAATATRSAELPVIDLGADDVLDSRAADLAAEVLRLTGGTGADLV